MSELLLTRRALLGGIAVAIPAAAYGQSRPRFGGVAVDVSPLQRSGDTLDARFFAEALPGFLHQYFAPYLASDRRAPLLMVRVDLVNYGAVGGATLPGSDAAIDYVEATGIVGHSQYPMSASLVTRVDLNDMTGEAAKTRMRNLAQAVAEYLPGKMGL